MPTLKDSHRFSKKFRAPLLSPCVGLLITVCPWNRDFFFLVVSQMLGFFFFNCRVEGKKEASLRLSTFCTRTRATLFSSFSLFCFLEILDHKNDFRYLLFFSKGSTETHSHQRGLSWDPVGYFITGLRAWASVNRQFSSSLAQSQVEAAHSFCAICFTFPQGVGACKRLLSTKLFLIKSPSSGVMINAN